jgi:hypothetical protein
MASAEDLFIPDLALGKILQPGDFAKLVFEIAIQDECVPFGGADVGDHS